MWNAKTLSGRQTVETNLLVLIQIQSIAIVLPIDSILKLKFSSETSFLLTLSFPWGVTTLTFPDEERKMNGLKNKLFWSYLRNKQLWHHLLFGEH
jgi:hypothetical protein